MKENNDYVINYLFDIETMTIMLLEKSKQLRQKLINESTALERKRKATTAKSPLTEFQLIQLRSKRRKAFIKK